MRILLCAKDIVDSDLCIGCGSCAGQQIELKERGMKFDRYGWLKPAGEWVKLPSEDFVNTCPFSPAAANEEQLSAELFPGMKHHDSTGRFTACYAGYAGEENFRSEGSSGGLVSWVACELMRTGLIDGLAHVISVTDPHMEKGTLFRFGISRNEKQVRERAKSRYYPVEMSEILGIIRDTPGRYAVVAVPCMIKAIQLLRRSNPVYKERIRFTMGLFCGHMKSSAFAESIAWQLKVPANRMRGIDFRFKYPDRPANWYNASIKTVDGDQKNIDWWHMADGDWGAGFFMNPACNFCDDVMAETSDISFGDAWIDPYHLEGKGTNVIIARSGRINGLIIEGIREGRLHLDEVDADLVARTQAAGLRMRREGLAFRLTWNKEGIRPVKRVSPDSVNLGEERKKIYRMRNSISKWSHLIFRFSKTTGLHVIYLTWARIMTSVYHGYAYHKGNIKEIRQRFRVTKGG